VVYLLLIVAVFGENMIDDSYQDVNIDISSVVIEQMKKRYLKLNV